MSAHLLTPPPLSPTTHGFCAEEGMERLRESGAKLTAQRLAMLTLFERLTTHLTAQEIHAALEHSEPGLSRATVYNNLELFEQLGLISRHQSDEGVVYYDANTSPHHHVICTVCGCVRDVHVPDHLMSALLALQVSPTASPAPSASAAAPFMLQAASLWFRGCCESCAARGE